VHQILLRAQVPFGGLHRRMADGAEYWAVPILAIVAQASIVILHQIGIGKVADPAMFADQIYESLHGRSSSCRRATDWLASRLAQYFFILAETSRRSWGDIDFLPLRLLAGASALATGLLRSSKYAITLSKLSFWLRNSSIALIRSISRSVFHDFAQGTEVTIRVKPLL
jgi:hypothetical protein